MAQMIPETISSKASKGEELLFKVLQERLPENYLVWYEPTIKRLLPDFIILGPAFGLLILEVRGWYAGNVELASHDFFQLRREKEGKTKIESHANPLKQGHGYFGTVADKMKGFPLLCRPEGNYRGSLAFPIGVGAIMSNITADQSREHALYTVLEQPAVAYRDELLDWPDCSSGELIARLKGMFKTDFAFPPLTDDQISTIKGLLHPVTIVREVPAIASSLPPDVDEPLPAHATRLLSLDLEQERLARTMKAGHRVISGVAGSGKTLILIARAKALANSLEPQHILILCSISRWLLTCALCSTAIRAIRSTKNALRCCTSTAGQSLLGSAYRVLNLSKQKKTTTSTSAKKCWHTSKSCQQKSAGMRCLWMKRTLSTRAGFPAVWRRSKIPKTAI